MNNKVLILGPLRGNEIYIKLGRKNYFNRDIVEKAFDLYVDGIVIELPG